MRAVFFGSRSWIDPGAIDLAIERLLIEGDGSLVVVHGDARGADRMAGELAEARGLLPIAVPADWDRHGKAAGPRRNQAMIDEHLLPFRDEGITARGFRMPGKSTGTDDMLARLKKAGIKGSIKHGVPGLVTPLAPRNPVPSMNTGKPYELWP